MRAADPDPLATILGLLGEGLTPAEVIAHHPQLVIDDVLACLRYAADLTNERFLPLASRNEPLGFVSSGSDRTREVRPAGTQCLHYVPISTPYATRRRAVAG